MHVQSRVLEQPQTSYNQNTNTPDACMARVIGNATGFEITEDTSSKHGGKMSGSARKRKDVKYTFNIKFDVQLQEKWITLEVTLLPILSFWYIY